MQFTLKTSTRTQMIDITNHVRKIVGSERIKSGVCHIFVPHTTAAVTINENADPDVPADILTTLSRLVPESGNYCHGEGNSDAHVKASLLGASAAVMIEEGDLALGTWQAIFFCEFDGPRTRKVFIKIVPYS